MLKSQQMIDTLQQIKIAKSILAKNTSIDFNVAKYANKTAFHSILNLGRNQRSENKNVNYRVHSCTPVVSKTVSKNRSTTQITGSREEMNFPRGQRNQLVSNSTQIPSDLKIISYLNNIKVPTSAGANKRYESSTASSTQLASRDREKVNESSRYSVYSSNCVEEYSYNEDQNICFKESMEDKGKSIEGFNGNRDSVLFCLFDGHGGNAVSKFLQKNYPYFFKKSLEKYNGNVEEALRMSFIAIDDELRTLEYVKVGSTGCIVYITKEKGNTVIYCANVGDTRASFIKTSSNEIKRLSYDHRADDIKEKKRIVYQGGMVLNGRVMGQLMLSRAFGDFELKSFGVKCDPYISKTVISDKECNQFIFIASDGVWDVMDEREIQKFLTYTFDTESLVDKILSRSIAKRAWDNLSVFAIKLC